MQDFLFYFFCLRHFRPFPKQSQGPHLFPASKIRNLLLRIIDEVYTLTTGVDILLHLCKCWWCTSFSVQALLWPRYKCLESVKSLYCLLCLFVALYSVVARSFDLFQFALGKYVCCFCIITFLLVVARGPKHYVSFAWWNAVCEGNVANKTLCLSLIFILRNAYRFVDLLGKKETW